jgi:hypothetical protein
MKNPNRFYVYAYIREFDDENDVANTPYYIGKGSGRRIHSLHYCKVPSNKFKVFICQNMEEGEAFLLEDQLISMFGRIDLNTGCLENRTGGGGCIWNAKLAAQANENRRKNPNWKNTTERANRGWETRRKNNNAAHSEESCKRGWETRRKHGKDKHSEATKKKIVNTHMERYGKGSSSNSESAHRAILTRIKNGNDTTSKPVTIDGVSYHSINDASRNLNMTSYATRKFIDHKIEMHDPTTYWNNSQS